MAVRTDGAPRLEAYRQAEKQDSHRQRMALAERDLKQTASRAGSDLPERKSTTRESRPAVEGTFAPGEGLDWKQSRLGSSEQAARSVRLSVEAARTSEPG